MNKETKEAIHAYVRAVNTLVGHLTSRVFIGTPEQWGVLQRAGALLLHCVDQEPEPKPEPAPPQPLNPAITTGTPPNNPVTTT